MQQVTQPIVQETSTTPESGSAGYLFGKYEVGKLLGCGAFAKVYHARIVGTGQSVAIKVISKQKVLKGNLTAHIKREISIMQRLNHPHIVRLHEVMATKTKIYFVLEFAKGGELFTKIAKGRFTEDLSRKYFHQLISAIAYCHSRGVYHRDLKLENILLDENWNLKVTDFGLSAISDQVRPDGLLHTLCGTPAYVAPELLAKKGYKGDKLDIWSCGIVLFVLNAGYLPFNDPNLMVLYQKIYKGDFRFPKWTSPDLKRLLSQLLDTNPETRITIDKIIDDPWYRKGYKQIKFGEEHMELKDEGDKYLNAFDIILYSCGTNLSGLFDKSDGWVRRERLLSAESPKKIIETVEEVGKTVNLRMVKKHSWCAKLEGQNGIFSMTVRIYRLTQNLVVVEIDRITGGMDKTADIWNDGLRPQLNCLIYQPASLS